MHRGFLLRGREINCLHTHTPVQHHLDTAAALYDTVNNNKKNSNLNEEEEEEPAADWEIL